MTHLVEENRRRGRAEPEFELIDTGVFADNRYFDVEIEYAKADVDDILMQVTIHNRAAEAATLHVLPQLWARNTWSWKPDSMRPQLVARGDDSISVDHPHFPHLRLFCEGRPEFLFCENETNVRRLWGMDAPGHYFKDGINDYVVNGDTAAVNPERRGTKVAAHYCAGPAGRRKPPTARSAHVWTAPLPVSTVSTASSTSAAPKPTNSTPRCSEDIADPDARLVQRQALAGMLWSKQFYYIDIPGVAERRSAAARSRPHRGGTAAMRTGRT